MKKAIVFLLMTAFLVCPALASESRSDNPLDAYDAAVTREATCGESGLVTYTDPETGTGFTLEIPATGEHDYEVSSEEEATCTQPGAVTYTCSVCGDTYTEEIPATGGHDYEVSSEEEATCSQPGLVTYTCSVCGDTYSEEIPPTGAHRFVYQYDAVQNEDRTFASFGTWLCEICGESVPADETTAVYYYGIPDEQPPAENAADDAPAEEPEEISADADEEPLKTPSSDNRRSDVWVAVEILAALAVAAEVVLLVRSLRKNQPF